MSNMRRFIMIVESSLSEDYDNTNWPALIALLIQKLPASIQQQVFQMKEGASSLAEQLSSALPSAKYAIWDTLYRAIEGYPPNVNNGHITSEANPAVVQEWQRYCQMLQKIVSTVKGGAAAPQAGAAPAAAPQAPAAAPQAGAAPAAPAASKFGRKKGWMQ